MASSNRVIYIANNPILWIPTELSAVKIIDYWMASIALFRITIIRARVNLLGKNVLYPKQVENFPQRAV